MRTHDCARVKKRRDQIRKVQFSIEQHVHKTVDHMLWGGILSVLRSTENKKGQFL